MSISEKTYYRYQRDLLFPAIHLAWIKDKVNTVQAIQSKKRCLAGDGQCDNPGHSAKYCVYTMLDCVTDKIIDIEVVQRSQCSSSVAMEKFGFQTVMDRIISEGLEVTIFASDRHVGIRKLVREKYTNINHQFDVWHYAKAIKKRLRIASQKKFGKEVIPWMDKIIRHFWWSIQTLMIMWTVMIMWKT